MTRAISILRRVGLFYRSLGIFGAGFVVGGIYCSTLTVMGMEAADRLLAVAL